MCCTDARFIVAILKEFNTHWCASKLHNKNRLQFAHCTANFTGSKQFVSVGPLCACAED